LVARDSQKTVELWSLADGQPTKILGEWADESSVEFCAGSHALLTKLKPIKIIRPLAPIHASPVYTGEQLIQTQPRYALWYDLAGEIKYRAFDPQAAVTLSPDGTRLCTLTKVDGAAQGVADLYDTHDGTIVATVTHRVGAVDSFLFGPKGQLATVEGPDDAGQTVYLWDSYAGAANGRLAHEQPIEKIAFSDDGTLLATITTTKVDDGDEQTIVHLWRTATAQPIGTLRPSAPIREIQLSPDGTRILLFDHDGDVKLWSTRSRRVMDDLAGVNRVFRAQFSPNGRWLAMVAQDGIVHLWDAQAAKPIDKLPHGAAIDDIVFDPQDSRFVSIAARSSTPQQRSPDTTLVVRLWQLDPDNHSIALHERIDTNQAILGPKGTWFVVGEGNLLRLWSTEAMKPISALYLDFEDRPSKQLGAIPNGCYLYTANWADDETIAAADEADKTQYSVQLWNAEHIFAIEALVDERRLVTCKHHVAGPQYTKISIVAQIVRSQPVKPEAELKQ
ncbi:MAG: hypothetical protein KDE58_41370, partial [Caldilineaceae bacterium]|nr:hypothetical protein [Caldilineaceae bacterium]